MLFSVYKVFQLGGADPEMLRKASSIAIPWGYTALNLNVGCPSDRVAGSGCFGAALMREPALVADCCAAMSEGAGGDVPITVKCRIGLTDDKEKAATADDEADYAALTEFVEEAVRRGRGRRRGAHQLLPPDRAQHETQHLQPPGRSRESASRLSS